MFEIVNFIEEIDRYFVGIKILMRWVAKLVRSAPACYGSSLDSNPDISPKIQKGSDRYTLLKGYRST
jgi:hypothetical protein